MNDREKVIYSIERCICHVPDACRDCSYDNEPCPKCFEHLLRDALSLLKAQEVRELTTDEWREWKNNPKRSPVCELWEHDTCAHCICSEDDDELDYVTCRLAGPEDPITMLWIPYDEASKQRHEACPLKELPKEG